MLWVWGHYKCLFFQCGDRLYASESDVYRRQILTYKDGPRAERVLSNQLLLFASVAVYPVMFIVEKHHYWSLHPRCWSLAIPRGYATFQASTRQKPDPGRCQLGQGGGGRQEWQTKWKQGDEREWEWQRERAERGWEWVKEQSLQDPEGGGQGGVMTPFQKLFCLNITRKLLFNIQNCLYIQFISLKDYKNYCLAPKLNFV